MGVLGPFASFLQVMVVVGLSTVFATSQEEDDEHLLALSLEYGQIENSPLTAAVIDNNSSEYEAPSVEIKAQVTHRTSNEEEDLNFDILVDVWWKILIWALAVVILSCLCCYFTRCCYLVWDCCTDPFWGCCPRCRSCKKFLLLKGFNGRRGAKYDICMEEEEAKTRNLNEEETTYELSEVDFTLRTVESVEDASKNSYIGLTPIRGSGQRRSKEGVVTSTPRRGKNALFKNQEESLDPGLFLELSGEAESVPQMYTTHYFNVLNLFGVGCSNYKVASVEQSNLKLMKSSSASNSDKQGSNTGQLNNTSSKEESSTNVAEESVGEEDKSDIETFNKSVLNNQDFPLSSSFNNMYKKNGLHIEEGQVGRYHPLPEARFELLPPASFLRRVKSNNSSGMRRRSRSMESFRHHNTNQANPGGSQQKRTVGGSLNRHGLASKSHQDVVVVHQQPVSTEPESSGEEENLSPPPPPPSSGGNCKQVVVGHYRTHSEGSRIGHRRTPSMEGVPFQNGHNKKLQFSQEQLHNRVPKRTAKLLTNGYSDNDSLVVDCSKHNESLPPKVPIPKKRYHRKMKLVDPDMEKYILYGKETTL